ncbi:hypothetical protein C2869_21220 [Saccharobesus litoralis]|uniref:TonB-dependent receptor plug domain-containing protein n=1 Tax=Saccharobesus litoralis TaxID=2172099 RepID=A0A2S0VX65_9ALTE|nr:TonB-dependent receptor plug domain-containing protein [Saccharobesus litoralis]AWB68762.1 hypothetical protein C2869_21220 [Saccharobesus litoralis]
MKKLDNVLLCFCAHLCLVSHSVSANENWQDIEVISITALKKATPLQQIAKDIELISADDIDSLHITGFADAISLMPSASYSPGFGPGQQSIAIRGVSLPSSRFQKPLTSVFLSKTSIAQTGMTPDLLPIDMQSIELVKGPQSLLHGESAMGGMIAYIPNKPTFDNSLTSSLGMSQVQGGGAGYHLSSTVNLANSQESAYRLSVFKDKVGGWIDNLGYVNTTTYEKMAHLGVEPEKNINYLDTTGLRLSALYDFDATEVNLLIHHQYQKTGGLSNWNPNLNHFGRHKAAARFREHFSDDFTLAELLVSHQIADLTLSLNSSVVDRQYKRIEDLSRVSQGLDYWVGDFNSNYNAELDAQLNHGQPANSIRNRPIHFRKYNLELLSEYQNKHWLLTFGGQYAKEHNNWQQQEIYQGIETAYSSYIPFYWHEDYQAAAQSDPNTFGVIGHDTWFFSDRQENIEQKSLFANVDLTLADHWRFSIGQRLVRLAIENDYVQGGYFGDVSASAAFAQHAQQQITTQEYAQQVQQQVANNYASNWLFSSQDERNLLSASINYAKFGLQTYLSYSQGFRPGGINRILVKADGTQPLTEFKSDELASTELGVKYAQQDWSVKAAVYKQDWSDIQLGLLDSQTSLSYTANGGQAEIKGLDIEAKLSLGEHVELHLATTYLDHAISALNDTALPELQVGNPLIGIADNKHFAAVKWFFTSELGAHSLMLNAQYTGDRLNGYFNAGDPNTPEADIEAVNIDSFSVANLSLVTELDKLTLSFYLDNIFNEGAILAQELSRKSFSAARGDEGRIISLQPRTFGFNVKYQF